MRQSLVNKILLLPAIISSVMAAHFLVYVFCQIMVSPGFDRFNFLVSRAYSKLWTEFFGDPYVYFGLPVIILLQQLIPIDNRRRLLDVNSQMDFLYAVFSVVFVAFFAPLLLEYLRETYGGVLNFGAVPRVGLSGWCHVVIGYLAIDFLGWFHHLARHKVPLFWRFHAVHHSQRKMNFFSNQRFHPMDWIFANFIKFVPSYLITNSLGIALGYIAIHRFLDRLNHSNVRTNLGWFRFILVTPQSHHVHHSSDPAHFDKNFGVSLSIWDHLFGTQLEDYTVFPATGIPDDTFPNEHDEMKLMAVVGVFFKQLMYPFRNIFGR